MSCENYRELLPAYLDDSLDEVRRTGLRAHLRACPECCDFAIELEPTLLFSLADRPTPSSERIEVCVGAVVAGVRQEQLQRRLRPARRPWLAVAAAVVMAVAAGSMWWMGTSGPSEDPAMQADANAVEIADPADVAEGPAAVEPPPRVEVDMAQGEVRVYQYAIEDDESTGAVFIVNPAMEL